MNVFLEAAYFDPIRTAATGRKLGINSDARYRFERGVDPAFVEPGAEIATRMILDLCGGEASELVIAGEAAGPQASRPAAPRPGEDARRRRHPAARAAARSCRRSASPSPAPTARMVAERAALAPRHQRRGRSRRGDRPHLRPRQGRACAAAAARDGHRPAHHAGAAPPLPRRPHARRARHERGGDLVVRCRRRRPSSSAAARRRWSSPIRSRPSSPTCAPRCCRT